MAEAYARPQKISKMELQAIFNKLLTSDPVKKKNDIFAFFYIFFSKSHILWNIVANMKKTKNSLNFYLQKKAGLLGSYVAL